MAPHDKQTPAWSNGELLDLISVWGEEAVQSQLHSSCRNYNTYGQISRAFLERGHDQDALQCRVKVKELWSPYCKAREGNCRSSAAPTTCRFYTELDTILGGDPTTTPRTTMDTSERGEEEEKEESKSEGTGVGGDTPESLEACSQELFSSQEEGSQLQQPVLGGGQTEERVSATLSSRCPCYQQLKDSKTWKKPRKKQRRPAASSYGSLCQRESKKCRTGGKGKAGSTREMQQPGRKHKAADKHPGAPSGLYPGTRSHAGRALPCCRPPSQSSFPFAPMSAQNPLPQHPGSYHHQLPPTPVRSPTSPENYDPYPLHSTPITMQYRHPEVQQSLHSTPDRTYSNL
ncbi:uncharacterized protein LOC142045990 [Chelonoidis abingdonii]|uniref:uncharacterized protein LOC142045990 n=1 Tax=Chelonoidis abingdonii TaxID=106734 RepID=UPI003F49AB76